MVIRIVTDSTCDIPPEVAAELGITVIPDYINVGEQSFLDGVDLTRREFYRRLVDWPVPPTTAAPGVDAFCKVYDRLAAEGASQVISFHIFPMWPAWRRKPPIPCQLRSCPEIFSH